MRLIALMAVACTLLGGCGSLNAATIDPADDVHCSVMAFYFNGFAKHQGAPRDQLRATKVMHEWYAAKMREEAAKRWGGMADYEKEIGPLLEKVKADPKAQSDKFMTCTQRAIVDPAFNAFARGVDY